MFGKRIFTASWIGLFTALIFIPVSVRAEQPTADAAEQIQAHFVDVAKRVGPAVVSISTEATEKVQMRRRSMGSPFSQHGEDPFEQFFEDFFGQIPQQREFKQRGLGTGVLIDPQGVILTNEHVIHGADKVTVTLPDGREFKGEVKGADIRADLAIVKIQAKNLPFARLGDSDSLKIGQWAIAIGNPFGFAVGGSEPTLTVGVISALHRAIQGPIDRDYSDLVQTDAAINPGNSGGPLVNLNGEVIGINVAIFSTTGGYQGLGFAITSNKARAILDDLVQGRKVRYGWFGVNVQNITQELADYFGLNSKDGVIVAQVLPGSPAEKGGIKDGDVIRSFDGQIVKDVPDLLRKVGRSQVGKKIALDLFREKKQLTVNVLIGERPDEADQEGVSTGAKGETVSWRGIEVTRITPMLAERFRLETDQGVLVADVKSGSPAEEAGFRVGDRILGINNRKVSSIEDFRSLTRAVKGDALVKTARGFAVLPGE